MKQFFIFLLLSNLVNSQELLFHENFDEMKFDNTFNHNWIVKNIEGKNTWRVSSHKNSKNKLYAKISGYKGSEIEKDLLILKQNLTKCYNASLEFETAVGYYKHNGLTVWTNDNKNIEEGNKLENIIIASEADLKEYSFSPFINSNKIDISEYCGGMFYLGFLYEGNNLDKSTVFEVDNIKIEINN